MNFQGGRVLLGVLQASRLSCWEWKFMYLKFRKIIYLNDSHFTMRSRHWEYESCKS